MDEEKVGLCATPMVAKSEETLRKFFYGSRQTLRQCKIGVDVEKKALKFRATSHQ